MEENYYQQSGKQAQASEIVLNYGVKRGKGRIGIAFLCESSQKSISLWSFETGVHIVNALSTNTGICILCQVKHNQVAGFQARMTLPSSSE